MSISLAHKNIDLSNIVVGCKLQHKAFGTGIVKAIEKEAIIISFESVDKKFRFPGLFLQGFLSRVD